MEDLSQRIEHRLWTPRGQGPLWRRALRAPLTLLSLPYSAFMRARAEAYRAGLFKSRRVPARVIVVGNLTVGGSGKTPIAAHIALSLQKAGCKPAVILRGYRGAAKQVAVVSRGDGPLLDAREAGDEAVMLARKLPGVPVITGADRVAAALLAIREFEATHLVLDDGYQHLRLERDLNVLVVDAGRDPAGQHLLPRGPLREPVSAAGRAHVIIFSRAESPEPPDWPWLDRRAPAALRVPAGWRMELEEGAAGKPVFAFCGIGSPDGFYSGLAAAGVEVKGRRTFPDHHRYADADLAALVAAARERGAEALVTTEKDAVKIDGAKLAGMPLLTLRLEPDFGGREALLLEACIGRSRA